MTPSYRRKSRSRSAWVTCRDAARHTQLHLSGQPLGLEWISQDPKPSASVLQGLFFGRVAPPGSERRGFTPPALIIGHPRDPIHPFSDSSMLLHELPEARLLEASSILELRLSPDRLTGEIVSFLEECWGDAAKPRGRRARTRAVADSSPNGSGTKAGGRRPA